jgi:hypothetical protein
MTSVPPDAPATLAPGTLNVQAQPTRSAG